MSNKLILSPEEALAEAVYDQLTATPGVLKRFLDAEAERKGSAASFKQRRTLLLHQIANRDGHDIHLRSLPNLVRESGSAAFVDVLLGLEQRVQRERRAERFGPVRVEPRARGREAG